MRPLYRSQSEPNSVTATATSKMQREKYNTHGVCQHCCSARMRHEVVSGWHDGELPCCYLKGHLTCSQCCAFSKIDAWTHNTVPDTLKHTRSTLRSPPLLQLSNCPALLKQPHLRTAAGCQQHCDLQRGSWSPRMRTVSPTGRCQRSGPLSGR